MKGCKRSIRIYKNFFCAMCCFISHKGNKYAQKDMHKIRPSFSKAFKSLHSESIHLKASI